MELYNRDCLETMDLLIEQGIKTKITITSPPYNMNLRIRNGKYCSRQIVKELTTKYKNFDDNLSMEDLFIFNCKVIDRLLLISETVFYNIQILTGNKPAFFKLMGEYHDKIKEIIIWDKVNAQPAIGKNVLNSQFEIILVFSNNSISRSFKSANFNRGTLSNLWNIKRGKKPVKCHGAVFPVELVEKIILNFTIESDIVLDPFTGTGTTGVACKNTNRDFIGIELDKDYYNIAVRRIEET